MFNRVLLIEPPSSSHMGAARPPCGLGYLAQSLFENGIEYEVEDMRIDGRFSELAGRIARFQPDLIGVSLVSYEYQKSYKLIHAIRREAPEAAIVVGGPHVSVMENAVLEECGAIDYGVLQEGERTLVQLCKGETPPAEIRGLLYRDRGEVRSGGAHRIILDLDNVQFPRYVNFDLNHYAPEIPLITSRGCPYRCIFCPNSLMKSRFVARSAANVVNEIEYWYERGIRQFNIDDDNFTLIRKRTLEICDEIERRRLTGLFIRCANGIRADRVDRPLLQRMFDVGIREVGIGADGGNNHILLDVINKAETIETIEQAVQDALAVGMKVKLFIILGHPHETMADIEDSLALAQRYPFVRVQLYNPIPYPRTALFHWVQENHYFLIPPSVYLNQVQDNEGTTPVFETPELPAETRRQILVRARRIEKDVTRRAVERMFREVPVFSRMGGWAFSTDFGQWLFFNNKMIRTVIDRVWYRRMTSAPFRQEDSHGLNAQDRSRV